MYKDTRKNMEHYDYNLPGHLEMAYRVPDNLFGKTLRFALKRNSDVNRKIAKDITQSRHHSVMRRKLSPLSRDKPAQASVQFPRRSKNRDGVPL